ncbi:unnamed protein product [Calicophoron daubneyi]|uniref:peptidylamidoglycolate lyase n=1 Tax=Calicophoron daubneyi TaxID=300641 RepID=A0AAV2SZD5_CALDB
MMGRCQSNLLQYFWLNFIIALFGHVQGQLNYYGYQNDDGDGYGEFSPEQLFAPEDVPSNCDDTITDMDVSMISRWPSKTVYQHFGPISAVAMHNLQKSNKVYVLHRGRSVWNSSTFDDNNVYQYQGQGPIKDEVLALISDGKLQEAYLKDTFYLPHGLTVDPEGNIWITDTAMHQIFKFSLDAPEKPLLVLGEKFVPGNDSKHFCKPTHVVVSRNGAFFVSDGYCNNRIIKFDKTGVVKKQWGKPTKNFESPDRFELNLPHHMALSEKLNMLCVADRENHRVVCYDVGVWSGNEDTTGTWLFEIKDQLARDGPVYAVAIAERDDILFVLVGSPDEKGPSDIQMFDLRTQNYLGTICTREPSFRKAHVIATSQEASGHGSLVACSLFIPEDTLKDKAEQIRRLWRFDYEKWQPEEDMLF